MISVGIDIGTYSVKVAEMEAAGKGYTLSRFKEIPLNQDPSKDNEIEVLEVLRQIHNQYDHANTRFVFAVRQGQASFRRRFFPFKERHKILKSLPFELEDDIPYDNDEAVFDARISRYIGNTADLLATACPIKHVEKVLQVASDAQIEPEIVSIEGLALANLFEEWRESPLQEEAIGEDTPPTPDNISAEIVLEMGHETCKILILMNGYLLDAYNIDWGGHDMAKALSKKYSLHIVEAIKELNKKSFVLINNEGATKDQIAFSDTIKSSLDALAHECQLILMNLKAQYNIKIKNVMLMGGASQIKNLGPYLTQKIEIPVNRPQTLSTFPKLDFTNNKNNELSCATAIGLALEGLRKPKNPALNLLKGEFAKQGQHLKVFWEKWNHTMALAGVAFLVFFVFAMVRENLALTMADEAQVALQDVAKGVDPSLKGSIVKLKGKINGFIRRKEKEKKNLALAEDLNKINSAMDILQKISALAPSEKNIKLDVKKFSVKNDLVKVAGIAGSNGLGLKGFEAALKGLALGGKVKKVPPGVAAKPGSKAFGFSFYVDRNGDL